ncbi:MAG: T9SS type A sorting domain-containing protein, partial [Bacteroidota bacterium]
QLYSWGANQYGQLGDGSSLGSITPVPAIGMTNVKFYSAGYFVAAIKSDNTGWVWAGVNNTGFSITPENKIDNLKFADAGMNHVVFVKNDGSVWGVGTNRDGELGNGITTGNTSVTQPVQMIGINNAVRAIAVGRYPRATVILDSSGSIYVTGNSRFNGSGSTVPALIPGLNHIVEIKGNGYAAYALDSAGKVFSFGVKHPALGTGLDGDPGFGGEYVPPNVIVFPTGSSPIIALSATNDGYSVLALDSSGKVYAWGWNVSGNLGDGTTIEKLRPVLVADNVIDIFSGENFSYILKEDNTLWATGQSGYDNFNYGSIWMNLPNFQRNIFTQIDPTIAPMNLCTPKVWGVVPIKLSSFTCVANGNTAYLNWQSAEEINADKCVVEYSKDGSNFQNIAIINAKGSNSNYKHVHHQVSGTAFYRLKMMDKDGSFKYSEIRVVKFDKKAGFTIAPNPANDVLYLFTKENAAIKSIQILSIDGQVVKILNEYNTGQKISISNLARGTYILKVVYQDNEMEYGRFIKMYQ